MNLEVLLIIESIVSIVLVIVILIQRRLITKLTRRVLELYKTQNESGTAKPKGSYPLDYDREHPRP